VTRVQVRRGHRRLVEAEGRVHPFDGDGAGKPLVLPLAAERDSEYGNITGNDSGPFIVIEAAVGRTAARRYAFRSALAS
jgi:hypothetical protein